MDQVVPWSDLVDRISPYYPECKTERGPVQLQTLLRTHCMQQWFELSDPAMEEAFYDTPIFREFAQTDKSIRLPDENTIMRFRYRLEKYKLDEQIHNRVSESLALEGLTLTHGSVIDAQLQPSNIATTLKQPATLPTTASSLITQAPSQTKKSGSSANSLLTLSEENCILYLLYQPTSEHTELHIQTLQALIADKGFSDCAIEESDLQAAIEKCNYSTGEIKTAIGKRLDAHLTVHIANDAMSARVHLSAAQGGKSLSAEAIVRTLHAAGVVMGIDEQALATLLNTSSAENLLVAEGRLPVQGENTIFQELITKHDAEADATDLDGRIDYRAQNSIRTVNEGDWLMRRIPATQGIAGFTVTGRTIEAQAGEDTTFEPDLPGTRLLESDSDFLVAAIAGHLVAVSNGMKVEPVIRLSEVNLSTGNIDFVGMVQIDGDVIQGMRVKATGNIVIGGVVERSFIETPGDIWVKGGVIGDAYLNAGGMIRARFGQSASIQSGKSIEIEEMAMQCNLSAQENITVGLKVPQRGRLVGGIARALQTIKVPFLGSDEGSLTRVIVGLHDGLENQFRTLQFAIAEKQSSVDNLTKIINQLVKTGDPKKLLDRANASLLETQNTVLEMERQSQTMDDQLNTLRKSKIEVTQEAAGIVELTITNYKVRLTSSFGRGHFSLSDENRVVHIDPKGFSALAH